MVGAATVGSRRQSGGSARHAHGICFETVEVVANPTTRMCSSAKHATPPHPVHARDGRPSLRVDARRPLNRPWFAPDVRHVTGPASTVPRRAAFVASPCRRCSVASGVTRMVTRMALRSTKWRGDAASVFESAFDGEPPASTRARRGYVALATVPTTPPERPDGSLARATHGRVGAGRLVRDVAVTTSATDMWRGMGLVMYRRRDVAGRPRPTEAVVSRRGPPIGCR